MERNSVIGCALRRELGRIGISGLDIAVGGQAAIFTALADAGVMVDDIVQTDGDGGISLAFTVEHGELAEARDVVRAAIERLAPGDDSIGVDVEIGLAKVSAVGSGMRSAIGVAGRMFTALSQAEIPILNITTSEIRISCLVPQDRGDAALAAVHEAFGLDRDPQDGPFLGLTDHDEK